MNRPGPDPRKPPGTLATAGNAGLPAQPQTSRHSRAAASRLVALAEVRHTLQSRGFQEGVAVAVIAVAALKGLMQENQVKFLARMVAWDKRQAGRLARGTGRQARKLGRTAHTRPA